MQEFQNVLRATENVIHEDDTLEAAAVGAGAVLVEWKQGTVSNINKVPNAMGTLRSLGVGNGNIVGHQCYRKSFFQEGQIALRRVFVLPFSYTEMKTLPGPTTAMIRSRLRIIFGSTSSLS